MKTVATGVKVTDSVLTQIVVRAAESVAGVRVRRPRRKVDVELSDARVHVDLELALTYGLVIPDVADAVQARVADAVGKMLDVEAVEVDVAVEELV